MIREFSAGGVVVRRMSGEWHIAVIEPQKEAAEATTNAVPVGAAAGGTAKKRRSSAAKPALALPKGLIDAGEKPEETAVREVLEETGVTATLIRKLADSKYVYVRSWGDKQRVFKVVSFYLLRYQSGRIDDITTEMRVEVQRALWLPLELAATKLAYGGERQVARKAQEYLESNPEV
jgi:8-oxo-dGTP pyrophosphatase MutT (NUDIX family)